MDNESSLSLKYVESMRDVLVERENKYEDGTNIGIQYLLQQPKIRIYLQIAVDMGGPLSAVKACYDNIRYLGYEGKIEFIYNDDYDLTKGIDHKDNKKIIAAYRNVKRVFPTFPNPDTTANAQVKFIRCIKKTMLATPTYYNNHNYGNTDEGNKITKDQLGQLELGFSGNNEAFANCPLDYAVLNCKTVLCGMNVGYTQGIGYKKNPVGETLLFDSVEQRGNPSLSTYIYHNEVEAFNTAKFESQVSLIDNEKQKNFLINLHNLVKNNKIHFILFYGGQINYQNIIRMIYEAISCVTPFKPVVLYFIKNQYSKFVHFQSKKIDGKGKWKMARYRTPEEVATNKPADPNDYFLDSSDWTKFIRECDEHFNCKVCNTIDQNEAVNPCPIKKIIGDEQDEILHSQLLTVYGGGFSNELFISLAKMSTLPVILEGAGFLNDCLRNGIPFLLGKNNMGCTHFLDKIAPNSILCKIGESFENGTNKDESIELLKMIFREVGDPSSTTYKFYNDIFRLVNKYDRNILYFLLNHSKDIRLPIPPLPAAQQQQPQQQQQQQPQPQSQLTQEQQQLYNQLIREGHPQDQVARLFPQAPQPQLTQKQEEMVAQLLTMGFTRDDIMAILRNRQDVNNVQKFFEAQNGQGGGYRKKSKRKTNKNKMLKKTKRVKKLYKKVSKKTKNRKVLKSKRLKKSRKNKN